MKIVKRMKAVKKFKVSKVFTHRKIFTAFSLFIVFSVSFWSMEAQSQRPTTFRSGTTLVSVDLVVRDRQGNIVRGLKAEDFEVHEDGQPQKILTFSFTEIDD